MIAVTGTNGKSTVDMLICDLLQNFGLCCCVMDISGIEIDSERIETNNTTPSSETIVNTLIRCRKVGIKYVVMEVSSTAIAQKRIEGCLFDILIYTNITARSS